MITGKPFLTIGLPCYSGSNKKMGSPFSPLVAQRSVLWRLLINSTEKICAPLGFNVLYISLNALSGS